MLGLLSSAALATSACSSSAQARRPLNIVLFMIDDLGWADLGCYNSELYQTPNIDALAAQGVRFVNAYSSCPACSPTRASVMTGKSPARLHITDWIPGTHVLPYSKMLPPDFEQQLPLKEVTIAEELAPLGYRSAAIGKWHLGKRPYFPDKQGFSLNVAGTQYGAPASYFYPGWTKNVPLDGKPGEYLTDRLCEEGDKFIRENHDHPFFLYLAHHSVHTPLEAKPAYVEKYKKLIKPGYQQRNPVYAAMVQSVDESVGRILRTLDELKLTDNTLVILASDNGGLSLRWAGRPAATSNYPLREGKGHIYEGGIRVPLIVRWPGVTKAGTVNKSPTISMDLYNTIAEIAGANPLKGNPVDGTSITPALRGEEMDYERPLYWHYPHYSRMYNRPGGVVRKGRYKLIEFYDHGDLELYDLEKDIGETKNLAAQMPDVAKRMQSLLHAWLKETKAQPARLNPNYDPKREWEGLGKVDFVPQPTAPR